MVLDVWEPEPDLSLPLLARVDIGTPHIAGYTLEGKARGTTQVFEAFSQHLGQPQSVELASLLPVPEFSHLRLNGELDEGKLKRLMHLVYDVRRDDAPLRHVAGLPGSLTACASIIRSGVNGHHCVYSAMMLPVLDSCSS